MDEFDAIWDRVSSERQEPDDFDAAWDRIAGEEPESPPVAGGMFDAQKNFLRAGAQGLTFGLSDELRGIGAALVPGGRGYTEARDAERQALAEMPGGSRLMGEIAGGIAAAPVAGAALAAKVPQFARLGRLGRSVSLAGAEGAAYGAGATDGGLGERVEGAVKTGALSAAVPAGIGAVGKGAQLTGRVAKSAAGNVGMGALIGEGLVETMAPGIIPGAGAIAGGNMASYLRRAFGRRQGRNLHQKLLDQADKIPGVPAIGRGLSALRGGIGRGIDALTGVSTPQPPPRAPLGPTTGRGAQPVTMNPARQIPDRTTASAIRTPPPRDFAGVARNEARTARAAREARALPEGPPTSIGVSRQIPARSSAPIVTPAPRAPRPEPNPQIQAYLASSAARRGRIGPEVPESLVVPTEASPGAIRQAQSTQFAQRARDDKVSKLVATIRGNLPEGVTANQVADFIEDLPREHLAEYVQKAGVREPSEKTWEQVIGALRRGDDPVSGLRASGLSDEQITARLREDVAGESLEEQLRKSLDLNRRLGRIGRP